MATVFVGLVLVTFVVNAIITKSKTRWWRDPGSLFRSASEPEPEVAPEPRSPRVRQPWEVTPRQQAAARREAAPLPPPAAQRTAHPAVKPPAGSGRHAKRAPVAVPIEHAETELIPRISESRARHERYAAR